MLTDQEKETLRKNIERYEGRINHLYLDSRGFVTVGVGHMIPDVSQAQKLNFIKADGSAASADDIKDAFEKVKQQPENRVASFYKSATALTMTNEEVDRLTDKHIETFHKELQKIYGDFDAYPSNARLALFDMIFNLGMTNLRKRWPKMNACVANQDWGAAAEQCRRKGIADERNDYVKDLFRSAGNTEIA